MDNSPNNINDLKQGQRSLKRLETLTDVVYAIVIWRLFMLLPRPKDINDAEISLHLFTDLITKEKFIFTLLLIGIVMVIIYWLQNNRLFSQLERTDPVHMTISIIQIFSVLIFLYAVGIEVVFGAAVGIYLMQSIASAIMGILSFAGWYYAVKKGNLIRNDLSVDDTTKISQSIMAEPITALTTIPFAFTPYWGISWFFYPIIKLVFNNLSKLTKR